MPGLRLNLGSGGRTDPGWTHVDVARDDVVRLDIREPWPWDDQTADAIVLHHVLDLLTPDECWSVLLKCARTLKFGACLRASGADLHAGFERAIVGDVEWFAERKATLEETVGFFLTQGGARRQYLDEEDLVLLLKQAGFPHVYVSQHESTLGPAWLTDLDDRPDESWFVEAIR